MPSYSSGPRSSSSAHDSDADLEPRGPEDTRGELRFLTCGSVDDGKSTLIGRLINDATGLFEDQIAALEEDSRRFGTVESGIDFAPLLAMPLSAREGDNVASRSKRTPWYDGPSLLSYLETVDASDARDEAPLRFPVQWVNRPDDAFRGFAGTVASGRIAVGDPIVV